MLNLIQIVWGMTRARKKINKILLVAPPFLSRFQQDLPLICFGCQHPRHVTSLHACASNSCNGWLRPFGFIFASVSQLFLPAPTICLKIIEPPFNRNFDRQPRGFNAQAEHTTKNVDAMGA